MEINTVSFDLGDFCTNVPSSESDHAPLGCRMNRPFPVSNITIPTKPR